MQKMKISPEAVLQKLSDAALTLCSAHSAGVSLLEDADERRHFHWHAISGQWRRHIGNRVPRDFSPCGSVVDCGAALLFSRPERDFPYLTATSPSIQEVLLIPFSVDEEPIGAIWIIAHDESRRFDAEDLRVMTSLGAVASIAYEMRRRLQRAVTENETRLLLVQEFDHRIKNLFALTSAVVTLSGRCSSSVGELVENVRDRLAALGRAHELVRPGVASTGANEIASLHPLIHRLFEPYVENRVTEHECLVLTGSDFPLGAASRASIALVLHELITNAAKHGALARRGGSVHIDCRQEGPNVLIAWKERGAPLSANAPKHQGFGTTLVRRIIDDFFRGQLVREWEPSGLLVRVTLPLAALAT
ncbi:MAG TPA: HWE histidine kinase domain-containing protein [Xanthobacteraceae bacterium]|nr:HWE histidine kinase domain-containing protein [Xanthobacteraceae bacterium]